MLDKRLRELNESEALRDARKKFVSFSSSWLFFLTVIRGAFSKPLGLLFYSVCLGCVTAGGEGEE